MDKDRIILEIKCLKRDVNILFKTIHGMQTAIGVLERQMERIGAPQYRLIKKGKPSKR